MPNSIFDLSASKPSGLSWRWILLCWGAALFLNLGFLVNSLVWNKGVAQAYPVASDSLIHPVYIQKAAAGFVHGDPFLWEHRADSAAIVSFFNIWFRIYGWFYQWGGDWSMVCLRTLFSGLWFYSLFRFCCMLGFPAPGAFLTAGVQAFFVVNFAYQLIGFKTHFSAYNLEVSEHVRLFPTVTAMAVYNLAVWLVARALESPAQRRFCGWMCPAAGAAVALTAYGRPFDWMAVTGAVGVLTLFYLFRRNRELAGLSLEIAVWTAVFSAYFVFRYFQYNHDHQQAFSDQITRGILQVKNIWHYVKYGVVAGVLIAWMGLARRRELIGADAGRTGASSVVWLCALAVSSLLVHYKTALDGGKTLVGPGYLMVFSIFPWFFLLSACDFLRRGWFKGRSRWCVAWLFLLLAWQQYRVAAAWSANGSAMSVSNERHRIYERIKTLSSGRQPVVLTLGGGVEAAKLTDCWLFFTDPCVISYVAAAPTTELLERFLTAKLLTTGTVADLAPVFSPDGLSCFEQWEAGRPPDQRFWLHLLTQAVGRNTFVIHPLKNRGELRVRKMELPPGLRDQAEFAAWTTPELRAVFERCLNWETEMRGGRLPGEWRSKYRLDFLYVPGAALPFVRPECIQKNLNAREIPFSEKVDGKLWEMAASPQG
ncbi:MAG: hypothetical protein PHV34_08370 [Verrucomicrobiae bacterium]|nr:hypothetical protein [Verrucomicrobiae bacterium]